MREGIRWDKEPAGNGKKKMIASYHEGSMTFESFLVCKGLVSTQDIKHRDQMDRMGSQLQVSEKGLMGEK